MESNKLTPGTVLQNRYHILSLLNQGGMGRIYLAEDQRFRSQVAVKGTRFTEEPLRRAFAREAGLLHRLRHRGLPHVTDHFTEGESEYLVMEFFPGKDLEELLIEKKRETGKAFAVEQVLGWADQLLDALEYLHGHQPPIVHRDIKPQNLKLTEQGDIILLDFGLAKGGAIGMSQAGESMPGFTYQYAPLEQLQGMGTDPRSDLYALAATIYRLVTGSLPPDALTRATAAIEGRADPLRPADELNDRVPGAVAAVLTRALSQLPADRLATATTMREALRSAIQAQASSDHQPAHSIDEPRREIDDPVEESEVADTAVITSSTSGPTNAGQVMMPAPALGSDATSSVLTNAGEIRVPSYRPRADNQATASASTLFGWFGLGVAWRARVAVGLMVLAIIALACWRLIPLSGPDAVIERSDTSMLKPRSFEEVMRYYLQVESETGRAERVAGAEPVLEGRWLKFHFMPSRPGYLYLIGPGEQTVRTAFLTAQPNPAWGVKSNLLVAGADYCFPSRNDKWIEVARSADLRTYIILFTPEPLTRPDFLAGAADRVLTPAGERQLAELQQRFGQQVRIETQGDQSIVTVPAERASGAPFLFEINLRRRTDQEGSNR